MGMLREASLELKKGIRADGSTIYVKPAGPGRFAVEEDLEVFEKTPEGDSRIVLLKLYHGRGAHYLPWAEVFAIDEGFYGSQAEGKLLGLLAGHLPPGAALYVEYEGDKETGEALMRGVPPAATRLGFMLYRLGFTWFKDWYFPEGALEGGRKLQGEKPLNEEARMRHLLSIRKDLAAFVGQSPLPGENAVISASVRRARELCKALP
jgi:hypothetical protein